MITLQSEEGERDLAMKNQCRSQNRGLDPETWRSPLGVPVVQNSQCLRENPPLCLLLTSMSGTFPETTRVKRERPSEGGLDIGLSFTYFGWTFCFSLEFKI